MTLPPLSSVYSFHARAACVIFLASASATFFSAAFLRSTTAFSCALTRALAVDFCFEIAAFSARTRSFCFFCSICWRVGLGLGLGAALGFSPGFGGFWGPAFFFGGASPSASLVRPISSKSRPKSFLGLALPLAAGLAADLAAGLIALTDLGFSPALGLAAGAAGLPFFGASFFAFSSGGRPSASRVRPYAAQSMALGSAAGAAGGAPLA